MRNEVSARVWAQPHLDRAIPITRSKRECPVIDIEQERVGIELIWKTSRIRDQGPEHGFSSDRVTGRHGEFPVPLYPRFECLDLTYWSTRRQEIRELVLKRPHLELDCFGSFVGPLERLWPLVRGAAAPTLAVVNVPTGFIDVDEPVPKPGQ